MNANSKNRTVIIAAVDRTAASEHVIHMATAHASAVAGSEIHFLYVVEPPMTLDAAEAVAAPTAEAFGEARVFIDGITRAAAERLSGPIAGHLGAGPAAAQILQLASDLGADLIVVGSHSRKALERWLMGSVSQEIVKSAQCAVLVSRPKSYSTDVPEIEPPCAQCLEVQRASQGVKLWCVQHSSRHAHGRLHYELAEPFGQGSTFLRP